MAKVRSKRALRKVSTNLNNGPGKQKAICTINAAPVLRMMLNI